MPATDSERMLIEIKADLKDFSRAMTKMQSESDRATKRVAADFGRMNRSMAASSRALETGMARLKGAFTVGVAVAEARKIAGAFVDVVERADDLVDAADKIGITTTSLKQLRYAAEQAGSSAEQMDEALARLSKGLAEARVGSGDLRKLLLANGMSEAEIAAASLEQVLARVADLIKNAKDEQDRAKIATLAFGRQFDELAVTFKDGATGVAAFRKEFNETHHDIGEAGDRELAGYSDDLKRLNGQWDSAVDHMTLYALAALEKIGEVEHEVVDAVVNAAKTVREQMTSAEDKAKAAGKAAGAAIKPLSRIDNVPLPTEPTGLARAVEDYIRRQRETPPKPTVVPSAGAAGGGAAKKTAPEMTTITTKGGLRATVRSDYAEQFQGLLDEIEERIIISRLSSFREGATVAGTGRPSQHSFGKAIDINPQENVSQWKSGGFSDAELRALAERWGLRWGGDFRKRDTMHFDTRGKAPMSEEALNSAKGISNELVRQGEIQRSNLEIWQDVLAAGEAQGEQLKSNNSTMETLNSTAEGAFATVLRGVRDGASAAEILKSVLDQILDQLISMASKSLANALFPTSGSGGLFSGLGNLLNVGTKATAAVASPGTFASAGVGLFAKGGDPPVNVPSIVGEEGPELFVPKVAGTIIPHDKLRAGIDASGTIHVTTAPGLHAEMSAISAKQIAENNRGLPRYLEGRQQRGF